MIKCPFCDSKLSNQNNHDGTHQIACPSCGWATPKRGEFLECLEVFTMAAFARVAYYWMERNYSAHMASPRDRIQTPRHARYAAE